MAESTNTARIEPECEFEPIGTKIRDRRQALGMTLQDIAEQASLSVGFISQLERDLTSPSLSSLVAITKALKSEIGDFLVMPDGDSSLTRSRSRPAYTISENSVIYERLTTRFSGHILNGVIVNEPPGYRHEPSQHEGEELFYVLKGAITVEVAGERTILEEGDSIHFSSEKLHSTWNHTTETARMLVIITMDLFGDSEE